MPPTIQSAARMAGDGPGSIAAINLVNMELTAGGAPSAQPVRPGQAAQNAEAWALWCRRQADAAETAGYGVQADLWLQAAEKADELRDVLKRIALQGVMP